MRALKIIVLWLVGGLATLATLFLLGFLFVVIAPFFGFWNFTTN